MKRCGVAVSAGMLVLACAAGEYDMTSGDGGGANDGEPAGAAGSGQPGDRSAGNGEAGTSSGAEGGTGVLHAGGTSRGGTAQGGDGGAGDGVGSAVGGQGLGGAAGNPPSGGQSAVAGMGSGGTGGRGDSGGTAGFGGTAGLGDTGLAGAGGEPGTGGAGPIECVRFANVSAPAGGDGSSWTSATGTVQEAIGAAAAQSPCEVWVAQGTYYVYSSSANDSIVLADGVDVYGGFRGDEVARSERDPLNHMTTLDGKASAGGSVHVYHVVTASAEAILDGFTITAGEAGTVDGGGGGIFAQDASPTIRSCTVTGNSAERGGGAFFSGGAPTVEDCTFEDNAAAASGGGVQMDSDGVISRCVIRNNTSGNDIAGIGMDYGAATVQNSLFYGNESVDYGGGLGVGPSATGALILNNTFYANVGPHGGGGVSLNGDAATCVNNVAVGNSGTYGPNILIFSNRTPVVHHNCGDSGIDGVDNVLADPGLVAAESEDFRLIAASPCVDQADDALAPPEDMTGQPRVDIPGSGTSIADIGALEYRP